MTRNKEEEGGIFLFTIMSKAVIYDGGNFERHELKSHRVQPANSLFLGVTQAEDIVARFVERQRQMQAERSWTINPARAAFVIFLYIYTSVTAGLAG